MFLEPEKLKKSIANATKYLRNYRKHYISQNRSYNTYDGGVSMLLLFFQNHYHLDFKFRGSDYKDIKLTKITQKLSKKHNISWYQTREDEDIFSTEFLQEIYFQDKLRYKSLEYQTQLEKYLKSGYFNKMSHLMPILDIFSQNQIKTVNVALGLYGLIDRGYKIRPEFKKEVTDQLIAIFENQREYDPQYLDLIKVYSLYLLYLLKEDSRINIKDLNSFMGCLIKHQASNGQWIHSTNFDQVRERDNTIMTVFALGILLEYYQSIQQLGDNYQRNKRLSKNKSNNKENNKENNITNTSNDEPSFWTSYLDKALDQAGKLVINLAGGKVSHSIEKESRENMIEGYQNYYPDPWDKITYDPQASYFEDSRCMGNLIELLIYLILIIFTGYFVYAFLRNKKRNFY